jgi:hypothetical protein
VASADDGSFEFLHTLVATFLDAQEHADIIADL